MGTSIETFFSAWGTEDAATRSAAIDRAVKPKGTYADPMTDTPLEGPEAIGDYVSGFTPNAPGATATVVDTQERHGWIRATVVFRMADGMAQNGQYFLRLAASGKIAEMIGFSGTGVPE